MHHLKKIQKGHFFFHLLFCLLLFSCATVKNFTIDKEIDSILKGSEVFSKHFTGFSLFDIESNKFIADYNSTLLFTPASNTKILTLYTVLKSFGDSIPGLLYYAGKDTLFVKPIGDPTFLHPRFSNQSVYELLVKQKTIGIELPDEPLNPFGNGWAWDDYHFDFQPPMSWWPIYGNSVTIRKNGVNQMEIRPPFFADFVEIKKESSIGNKVEREMKYNLFNAHITADTLEFEKIIPFDYSDELLLQLLTDTLQVNICWSTNSGIKYDTIFSQHRDSVLARMMKPSDNFLAEQLLLQAAYQNGCSDINPFLKFIKLNWLKENNDMVWVDGSGLSRYNLIAPVDQVRVLKKIHDEYGWELIASVFATGGEGTLKELYVSDEPYIYAKTGTLSNNHNLSGYLITKSGRRMIFSLMNNHYIEPTSEIKKEMERFLTQIKDAY